MINIRHSVFETNSSSQHSLVIVPINTYNDWVNNIALYYSIDTGHIADKQKMIELLKSSTIYCCNRSGKSNWYDDPIIVRHVFRDSNIFTYQEWKEHCLGSDCCEKEYETLSGDKIKVISRYSIYDDIL